MQGSVTRTSGLVSDVVACLDSMLHSQRYIQAMYSVSTTNHASTWWRLSLALLA